jgi:type IX secretion system PorP/SprF family membrane protein
MKYLLTCLLLLSYLTQAYGQDPEFSQYYAAPLYLNPAFAGTTTDHRFIANYRNQWPSIGRGYVSYAFSYDYNLYHMNSGIGLMATVDQAGTAGMKSSTINFIYSYRLHLNDKWVVSSGLNFGFGSRTIDLNKLVFGDQLQFDAEGNVPTDDQAAFNLGTANYFDFNAGFLLYNRSVWLGMAMSHLNTPNRSLVSETSELPLKTTIHGGARIPLYWGPQSRDRTTVLLPSFVYKKQDNFDQLDIGAYLMYEPILFGFWYRGIPIQQNVKDNLSQDAFVFILGFQFDRLELGYSYDFTVSELGPASGGTHELSMRYKMPLKINPKGKRIQKMIPCPTSPKQK